jgi:hypothetical protein
VGPWRDALDQLTARRLAAAGGTAVVTDAGAGRAGQDPPVPPVAGVALRRGRGSSSPPQLGQRPLIWSVQAGQKVHS